MGDASFSQGERLLDQFRPRLQEVPPGQLHGVEQPVHRVVMGLEPSVGEDMGHGDAAFDQAAADQDRAVAIERLLLRAHQRDAIVLRTPDHPVDPLAEESGPRHAVVAHLPVLVAGAVVRTPAERAAEEQVGDAAGVHVPVEGLAVEVRVEAAVGGRTNVGERRDGVPPQQRDEGLQRMCGVRAVRRRGYGPRRCRVRPGCGRPGSCGGNRAAPSPRTSARCDCPAHRLLRPPPVAPARSRRRGPTVRTGTASSGRPGAGEGRARGPPRRWRFGLGCGEVRRLRRHMAGGCER